jgi:Fe-S-cluster containining protein
MDLPADPEVRVWLELRGRKEGDQVRLSAPCSCLDRGVCTIYLSRPEPCRVFQVGSPACIASIRANRPKETQRLINLARKYQTK